MEKIIEYKGERIIISETPAGGYFYDINYVSSFTNFYYDDFGECLKEAIKKIDSGAKPENIIEENRVGKFYIANDLIEKNPKLITNILHGIVIVRAESKFARDQVEYVGYSKEFKKVGEGLNPPEYEVIIDKTNGDCNIISFEKLN